MIGRRQGTSIVLVMMLFSTLALSPASNPDTKDKQEDRQKYWNGSEWVYLLYPESIGTVTAYGIRQGFSDSSDGHVNSSGTTISTTDTTMNVGEIISGGTTIPTRGFVKFSLAGLAGLTLTSATLKMTVSSSYEDGTQDTSATFKNPELGKTYPIHINDYGTLDGSDYAAASIGNDPGHIIANGSAESVVSVSIMSAMQDDMNNGRAFTSYRLQTEQASDSDDDRDAWLFFASESTSAPVIEYTINFPRSLSDTSTSSELLARNAAYPRPAVDSSTASETVSRYAAYSRSASEGFPIVDMIADLLVARNTGFSFTPTTVALEEASITFPSVLFPGSTRIIPMEDAPPLPPLYKPVDTPVDIITSALVGPGMIEVCLRPSGAITPFTLLAHYEFGQWLLVPSKLDFGRNEVCGMASSLSPFAAVDFLPPTPPSGESHRSGGRSIEVPTVLQFTTSTVFRGTDEIVEFDAVLLFAENMTMIALDGDATLLLRGEPGSIAILNIKIDDGKFHVALPAKDVMKKLKKIKDNTITAQLIFDEKSVQGTGKIKTIDYLSVKSSEVQIKIGQKQARPEKSNDTGDGGFVVLAKDKKHVTLLSIKNKAGQDVYAIKLESDCGISSIKAKGWKTQKIDSQTVMLKSKEKPLKSGDALSIKLIKHGKSMEYSIFGPNNTLLEEGRTGAKSSTDLRSYSVVC